MTMTETIGDRPGGGNPMPSELDNEYLGDPIGSNSQSAANREYRICCDENPHVVLAHVHANT
jgi:hypothetical protein